MAKANRKKVLRSKSAEPAPTLSELDASILKLFVARHALVQSNASEHSSAQAIEESLASAGRAAERTPTSSMLDRDAADRVMKHLASVCHLGLHADRVAFLGPEYSFSHLAAVKYFGEAHPMMSMPSIAAVFEAVVRHDAKLGLVPVENSTDGRIVDTLGMFVRNPVNICGEVLLPIHHYLLGKCQREEVREVYSKPQAISQCRGWLATQLPGARIVDMSSTTAAAQLAAERPGAAAIASLEAGQQHQLNVIDACIEDNPNNVTRFAILGERQPARTGNDKTSLLFQVPHEPGALADAMMIFKRNELNLTWIESFPLPGVEGEYLFFAEVLGHVKDKPVATSIEQLSKRALRVSLLGSYPRGKV